MLKLMITAFMLMFLAGCTGQPIMVSVTKPGSYETVTIMKANPFKDFWR